MDCTNQNGWHPDNTHRQMFNLITKKNAFMVKPKQSKKSNTPVGDKNHESNSYRPC